MTYALTCFTEFGVTCFLLWLLRPLAVRIGLVDQPGERKCHNGDVALIGGIAIFVGLVFSVLMIESSIASYRPFFAGAALLIGVGILDDFHELPSWARFAAQIVAGLLMTLWGGVVVTDLGAITGAGNVQLGMWAVPFTVFATIGVINAVNMVDGVDGLGGGIVLISLSLLAWIAYSSGQYTEATILLLLICTVVAFLLFNMRLPGRKHALVFMGDAGSMFLGFVLAWFAVSLSQGGERAMTPVTALWVLALPLIDTVSVIVRRSSSGRPLFEAARDHFHHVLLNGGRSVNETARIMLGMASVAGLVGAASFYAGLPETVLFAGFLFLGLMHLWNVWRLDRAASPLPAPRNVEQAFRQYVVQPVSRLDREAIPRYSREILRKADVHKRLVRNVRSLHS
jgi:UDP-GlcNAc:undecaprenyl-phosphate/decaprenyl-phosphate GlcNAc-1-phosphate transferase